MIEENPRTVEEHRGKLTICVKDPYFPEELLDEFEDEQRVNIFESNEYNIGEEIASLLGELECKMRKKYPSYDISIEWTGRSGGWFDLIGNWPMGRFWHVDNRRAKTIDEHIIPYFENGVKHIMDYYHNLWEDVFTRAKLEIKEKEERDKRMKDNLITVCDNDGEKHYIEPCPICGEKLERGGEGAHNWYACPEHGVGIVTRIEPYKRDILTNAVTAWSTIVQKTR